MDRIAKGSLGRKIPVIRFASHDFYPRRRIGG
jgi:hypothetical protein